ncbi:hypothetical protein [Nocardia aurantiaca]|uniref:Uncharacterized protein n=1 Tax=Nocardia aurantiaca TaxID=2675850 RepID=A0A6I3L0G4_9NOCA|nr:hypothetical protein [Nocardia aurantiaca]MTE14748.1 hypothetical protein [Nocardia aurantiaca]
MTDMNPADDPADRAAVDRIHLADLDGPVRAVALLVVGNRYTVAFTDTDSGARST